MRNINTQKEYDEYKITKNNSDCQFCDLSEHTIIETQNLYYIAKNRFPYEIWDCRYVEDHLMLIPKRHISTYHERNIDEKQEQNLIEDIYMERGYNICTRSPLNSAKSVNHLHTHFIKVGEVIKGYKFNNIPYQLDLVE